jgi:hypothetical protein
LGWIPALLAPWGQANSISVPIGKEQPVWQSGSTPLKQWVILTKIFGLLISKTLTISGD